MISVDVSRFQDREMQRLSHVVGDNVTLPCQLSLTGLQRWLYTPQDKSRQYVMTSGSHVQLNNSRVMTLHDSQTSQEYGLTMHNVQLNETGWYICVGDGDSTIVLPFFLTVHG